MPKKYNICAIVKINISLIAHELIEYKANNNS